MKSKPLLKPKSHCSVIPLLLCHPYLAAVLFAPFIYEDWNPSSSPSLCAFAWSSPPILSLVNVSYFRNHCVSPHLFEVFPESHSFYVCFYFFCNIFHTRGSSHLRTGPKSSLFVLPVPGTEPEHIVGLKKVHCGTSLVVQWLRLCTSTAGSLGLIPGQGTKIPHAMQCQKRGKKKKRLLHLAESPRLSKLQSGRRAQGQGSHSNS